MGTFDESGSENDDQDVPVEDTFQWDQSPVRRQPSTHWNVARNPQISFACPFCGTRVRLHTHPDIDKGNIVAGCGSCGLLIGRQEWQHYKEMQV